jgi:cobalamin synthase
VTVYVIVDATWRMLSETASQVLFLMVLLLGPIFYPLTKDLVKSFVSEKEELLVFLLSFGAVLLVLVAGVAFAAVVLHLFVSKRIWSLASRARKKASGKPLPELFRQIRVR